MVLLVEKMSVLQVIFPPFLQPFYPRFLYHITIPLYKGMLSSTFNKIKSIQNLLQEIIAKYHQK